MNKTKYEVIEIDHTEITVDVSLLSRTDSMFFNATEIAKEYGKTPREWLKLKETKAYIDALLDVILNHNGNREKLVITRRGGKHQGTWLHNDLAIAFARWLDIAKAVKMDLWMKERIAEEHDRRRSRLEAKTGFLPLTEAIQAAHDEPQWHHYSNEMRMLCEIVTGYQPKQFRKLHDVKNARDGMNAAQLVELRELEALNTALINRGMPYKARKRWLTEQHEIDAAA